MPVPMLSWNMPRMSQTIAPSPLLATGVRGSGGGKTCALEEEIRWELLGKPRVLPLAITFNATKELHSSELHWSSGPERDLCGCTAGGGLLRTARE